MYRTNLKLNLSVLRVSSNLEKEHENQQTYSIVNNI